MNPRFVLHNDELTQWFLNHGTEPNAMCAWNFTPLSSAIHLASLLIIKLLCGHGGDVRRGQFLHAIKQESSDKIEVLRLPLDLGALVNEAKYQNHWPSYQECW
jgi:hypothetical protein